MSGTDCFEIERVLELFKKCRPDGDQVIIDGYVDAYEDLCKLFPLLGTVFGFVASDVNEKIGILRDYRKSPEAGHYETITNMINYEVENNLTEKKHKPLSGARTLLRLHRALQFVIEFMRAITTMDLSKKLTTVASEAYHKTLANHHPWVIKKAVGMAMYTLPTGEHLISKMGSKDAPQIRETMGEVITLAQGVYDHTETLYTTNNLLNLP